MSLGKYVVLEYHTTEKMVRAFLDNEADDGDIRDGLKAAINAAPTDATVALAAVVEAANAVEGDTYVDNDGHPNVGYDGAGALLRMFKALHQWRKLSGEKGDKDNV